MEASRWFAPPHDFFKVNSDTTFLNGEVGMGAIVRESKGKLCWSYISMTEFVELVEAIIMLEGLFKALEADIFPLWVEIDPQIVWYPLIGKSRYESEAQVLVNFIRDLYPRGFVLEFLLVNHKNNFVVHSLLVHA